MARPVQSRPGVIPAEQPTGAHPRGKVLLVDDEESVLFAIHEYLTLRGYEAVRARDRETAERLLETASYAWVVTDLHLGPGLEGDGFAVAERARLLHPSTKILLLTAHGSPEVEAAAARSGIDKVVGKPVGLADLERVMNEPREEES